jgi:hypothetical protein
MHNANKPNPDDLPSSAQLLKSTGIAAIAAVVILVTVVLPSEYGIDPTGIGGAIGLTEMGTIKTQLAEEAEADRLLELENSTSAPQSSLQDAIFGLFVGTANAQAAEAWADEYSVTLAPGEGVEVKLVMEDGAQPTTAGAQAAACSTSICTVTAAAKKPAMKGAAPLQATRAF